MKSNKKGFTLVELIIVIAVIAILAAVLIPVFSGIIKKTQVSKDNQLIRNMNTAIATDKALNGEHKTMTDALAAVAEAGYLVGRINKSAADNEILWDSKNDVFCYYNAEKSKIEYIPETTLTTPAENVKDWEYWQIVDVKANNEAVVDLTETYNYSIYLRDVDAGVTAVTYDKGVDVGENTVSVNYRNTENSAQTVVIRTNSYDTALVVNAPLDTVHHYGELMSANLQKVSSSSYYEHGDTNLVEIASGRLVITNDTNAKVDNVYLTATNDNYKVEEVGIIIATQTGAKLPDVIRRDAVTETAGKVVCTIQTNVDENGENPQKVDNVTIKGEDNVQEAKNGYTNVADLTKMVLEAPTNSEVEGASEFIGNDVAVATEEKQGVISEAKGTVIEVTFKGAVSIHTISEFRDLWNAGEFFDLENSASIKLTGNVDMKKVGNWGPIGTWEYPFFGTFDGNDKTISDLTNHASADSSGKYTHVYSVGSSIGYGETYGFFGIVGGGDTTIKNVTFNSVDINIENGKNVGAVIGYVPKNKNFTDSDFAEGKWSENTTIGTHSLDLENVTVNGSVEGKSHVAGLIGKMYATGELTLKDCTNNTSVTSSSDYCGGFVAYSTTTTTFTSCTNTGAVHSGSGSVGGLLGRTGSLAVTFDTCTNTGNIESTNSSSFVGGFVGYSNGNAVLTFKKCNNSGNITGTRSGGFFGGTDNATTRVCFIETAVNSGTINGSEYASNFIGILAGACDWDTGTTYDSNSVRNNPNVSISCIKHSDVIFTTVDASKLIATNGKVAKYWTIGAAHGAIVNNLDSETFETTYDATCVNNSTF